jgi:hypothetical protein
MDNYNMISENVGLILGVLSLFYAFYQTKIFSRGVNITALLHLRNMINRMEEEKKDHEKNSAQWKTMHHTQQELETLFKSLQITFDISGKKAPR